MALFHCLGTWSEKCYCSQALCTERVKTACEAEQDRCCTVLKWTSATNRTLQLLYVTSVRHCEPPHTRPSCTCPPCCYCYLIGTKTDGVACKSVSGLKWRSEWTHKMHDVVRSLTVPFGKEMYLNCTVLMSPWWSYPELYSFNVTMVIVTWTVQF